MRREKADSRHYDWSNMEGSGRAEANTTAGLRGFWLRKLVDDVMFRPQGRKIEGLVVFEDIRNIQLAVHCRKPTIGLKLETGVRLGEWS